MKLPPRMRNIRKAVLKAVFNESAENHVPQIWAIGFLVILSKNHVFKS